MIDEQFIDAAVTYVWGDHSLPWPSERLEALADDQIDYLPRVRAAIAITFADGPPQMELSAASRVAREAVRAAFPELSDEAIRAIGNLYAYSCK